MDSLEEEKERPLGLYLVQELDPMELDRSKEEKNTEQAHEEVSGQEDATDLPIEPKKFVQDSSEDPMQPSLMTQRVCT